LKAVSAFDPNDLTANRYLGDLDLRRGKPVEGRGKLRHAREIARGWPEILQGLDAELGGAKQAEAADVIARSTCWKSAKTREHGARLIHLLLKRAGIRCALAELARGDAGNATNAGFMRRMRADIQIAQKKNGPTRHKRCAKAVCSWRLARAVGRRTGPFYLPEK